MSAKKKNKYLKKTVEFQGSKLILYSLDGDTWSSRKDELHEIIERHEIQKQNFGGQIKGGPQVKTIKPESSKKARPKKLRKMAPVTARGAEEEVKEPQKVAASAEPKKTAAKSKTKAKAKAKEAKKTSTKEKAKKTAAKKTAAKTRATTKTKTKTKSKAKAKSARTTSKKKVAAPKGRATGSPKKKTGTKAKKKSVA